ncbi:hypothetical protein [Secundilactobacillus muriivasis]
MDTKKENELHPGFLLKFVEKQFLDSFVNRGQLHFSQIGYFKDIEEKEGDNVIGDKSEGSRVLNLNPEQSTVILTIGDNKYKLHGMKDGIRGINYEYTEDAVRQWGVVSLCNIDLFRDAQLISYDSEKEIGIFRLKQAVLDDLYRLSDDGKRVPVILDSKGLLNAMDRKFSDGKRNIEMKNIKYYSEDTSENISFEDYQKDPKQIVFFKRNAYRYQREVRIALFEKVPYKTGTNIEIGSIKQSTAPLESFDVLSNLEFTITGLEQQKE